MKRIDEVLLVLFTLILIFSGIFNSLAQDKQSEKEETIFYLMNRVQILNKYYDLGAWTCSNLTHSMEGYKEYIEQETTPLTDKIGSFNSKIDKYNLWAKIFLCIAISGHVFIIFLETIENKKANKIMLKKLLTKFIKFITFRH